MRLGQFKAISASNPLIGHGTLLLFTAPPPLCCYGGFNSYQISWSSLQYDENKVDCCKLGLALGIASSQEPKATNNNFLLPAGSRALPAPRRICFGHLVVLPLPTPPQLPAEGKHQTAPWFASHIWRFTKTTLKPLSSPSYIDAQKYKTT